MFGKKTKKLVQPANLRIQKTVVLTPLASPGQPAASLSLIKNNGVSFEKKVASAVDMQKRAGITNRWDVIALIDESYSMQGLFADGTVQAITERALAWTAGVDADGMAPVGGFANGHKWHGEIDLTNVMGIVAREGWSCWGGTDLVAGLTEALDVAKGAENPVYLFIITDGAPNDQAAATRVICEMSQYPIFVKFLLVGNDPSGKRYLEMLDDMTTGRLFDNVDCQHISNPSTIDDDAFSTLMCEEVVSAIGEMQTLGLAR